MVKLNDNAVAYMKRQNFSDILLRAEEVTS